MLDRWRGPFEAQRLGLCVGLGDYADYFGPIRRTLRAAIPDAERLGPGAVVRNTRTGRIVWRVYGLSA